MFILENVKGFTTLQNGSCLRAVLKSLMNIKKKVGVNAGDHALATEAGDSAPASTQAYRIYHKLINTKEHGVPQHRERWYCTGLLRDEDDDSLFKFPAEIGYSSIDMKYSSASSSASAASTACSTLHFYDRFSGTT